MGAVPVPPVSLTVKSEFEEPEFEIGLKLCYIKQSAAAALHLQQVFYEI